MQVPGIDVLVQLPGEPRGKGRPRAFVLRGRALMHTDAKTRKYEELLRGAARNAMRDRSPLEGPVDMAVEAHFSVPKSWPKRRREAALAGAEPHTTRPDCDNVVKAALDAFNGIVWRDDSQVVRIIASKHYGVTPGLVIAVNEIKTTPLLARGAA